MATTLLESTRQMHEDMERLERLIVKDLRTETKTHKDKLLQSHRIRGMLDAIQDRANSLVMPGNGSGDGRCACGRARLADGAPRRPALPSAWAGT